PGRLGDGAIRGGGGEGNGNTARFGGAASAGTSGQVPLAAGSSSPGFSELAFGVARPFGAALPATAAAATPSAALRSTSPSGVQARMPLRQTRVLRGNSPDARSADSCSVERRRRS